MSFPYRRYNKDEILHDFDMLAKKINLIDTDKVCSSSNVGKLSSNNFFQYNRMDTPRSNHLSNIEFWEKKKEYIMKFSNKYPKKDLFSILLFLNKTPCQFPPLIAGYVYKLFNAKTVIDPFAGWGDRCIAAMACGGIKYIGFDTNIKLEKSYNEMINFFSNKIFITPKVYYSDISEIDITVNKQHTIIFSSPPFFDERGKSVENYYNDNNNNKYDIFMDKCMLPLMKKSKDICEWTCFHLPKNMYLYILERYRPSDKEINFGMKQKKQKNILLEKLIFFIFLYNNGKYKKICD